MRCEKRGVRSGAVRSGDVISDVRSEDVISEV